MLIYLTKYLLTFEKNSLIYFLGAIFIKYLREELKLNENFGTEL